MKMRTCVAPSGRFIYGIHTPAFRSENLREKDTIAFLGVFEDGSPCLNHANFPDGAVREPGADPVYEIPNPFPFRGSTFIIKRSADRIARDPDRIPLDPHPEPSNRLSLTDSLRELLGDASPPAYKARDLVAALPRTIRLALAVDGTDPEELAAIAEGACEFVHDPDTGRPAGLTYRKTPSGRTRPVVHDHEIFEAAANNLRLPDDYKRAMLLLPGVQGDSEIVGEWVGDDGRSHVFEYLRRNSYIPWGHYAANMAHDAIRYRARDLTLTDMTGMRHLYYQRTFVRLASGLGIPIPAFRRQLSVDELERLRGGIMATLTAGERPPIPFTRTLWGWNFGFGYAASGYRLHGSHQQIHQQYALIPEAVRTPDPAAMGEDYIPGFACGDPVDGFIRSYKWQTGRDFFDRYVSAIRNNRRMDGDDGKPSGLVVWEDDRVILFVPKAQTSQWELQLMPLAPVGNILEADAGTRASVDKALLAGVRVLEALGARMVTHIEFSKRIDAEDADGRLLYSLLPKLPFSPGAFTEAQLRWINGHYPEDFAVACRNRLPEAGADLEIRQAYR
jgi:hypothetical protein